MHLAGKKHRTMIGGQAVIEGVMMRGVKSTAMSVRKPDGSIQTDTWENVSIRDRYPVLRLPVLRGVVSFVEMLIFGYKSLMASAEIASAEDGEEPDGEKESGGTKALEVLSLVAGLAVAVLLFSIAPTLLTSKTDVWLHYGAFRTLVEGIIRIAIFLLYLFAVSRMKDIRRVYEYHGAEHKTIYCYEHGEELTVANARKYVRLHPRCGTSFLLIVMVVSILVFSFVTWRTLLLRIVLKLLLLPLVVGISYEIIRFAGRHDNSVMRFVLAPGLWLQKLTTREPDDSQLEVAIRSLQAVLTQNPEDDVW